ncbi:MAG: hypothetical protein BWX99_03033 [Deltaproteobacteria bacterium ADurb.Bin151]|nr:MAG: hypothetical protein BWX99_03033 [Deltaproteobacteria bacterium ADurb.Bin151]
MSRGRECLPGRKNGHRVHFSPAHWQGLGPGQNPRNGQRVHGRPPYIRTIWPRVVLTSRPPTCQNLTRRKNRATRNRNRAGLVRTSMCRVVKMSTPLARHRTLSATPAPWQVLTGARGPLQLLPCVMRGSLESDVVHDEPHLFLSQTAQIDLSAPGSGSSGHRDHLIL